VLKGLKLKVVEEPSSHKFAPDNDKEASLVEYGKQFSLKLLEDCGQQ